MKRCPHCKGYAKIRPLIVNSIQVKPKFKRIQNPPLCWFVQCNKCTARTSGKTKIKAIKEWNRRE